MSSLFSGPSALGQSGVALFMVLMGIAVLSLVASEFTYVAHINRKVAYDGLDQLKAHYLAKSALKMSLLRLRAFQSIKKTIQSLTAGNAAAQAMVPKSLLDEIWKFPFTFPLPENLPGISGVQKDEIHKFLKDSVLDGRYTSIIDSESSKVSLNSVLPGFQLPAPPAASPSPGTTPTGAPTPAAAASGTPGPAPTFNPEEARRNLAQVFSGLIQSKSQDDEDFAKEYRDFKIEEFMDGLLGWVDRTYQQRRNGETGAGSVKTKQAPFFHLSELHMVPQMNDELYELFEPALTVVTTAGINVNSVQESALRGLVPLMTATEAQEFIKYRDSSTDDHSFKAEDDFFKYLLDHVAGFRNSQSAVDQFRTQLQTRGVRIVVEENVFHIFATGKTDTAKKTIEAIVVLSDTGNSAPNSGRPPTPNPPGVNLPPPIPGAQPLSDAGAASNTGLSIPFMRIL